MERANSVIAWNWILQRFYFLCQDTLTTTSKILGPAVAVADSLFYALMPHSSDYNRQREDSKRYRALATKIPKKMLSATTPLQSFICPMRQL